MPLVTQAGFEPAIAKVGHRRAALVAFAAVPVRVPRQLKTCQL